MCVAVAGRIISIGAPSTGAIWSQVEFGDRVLKINLVMLPDVGIGDHVLVHSGYAIRTVSPRAITDRHSGAESDHETGR
jgi:hydrogenase assembly chaperone HypC/HupF